jgi:hypothetical protein
VNVTSHGIIFTVPQICAYFVDNPHNLEIDSFKIAVSEHILLYFKNSNSLFSGVLSFSIGKHSTGYVYSFTFQDKINISCREKDNTIK